MKTILLLLAPNEAGLQRIRPNIPPLGPAQIQGYLRQRGFDVALHDLGLALRAGAGGRPLRRWERVLDKRFALEVLRDGAHLDEVAELFDPLLPSLDFSGLGAIGISVGGNFSLFEIHSAFLIGRLLQSRCDVPIVFGGTDVTYLYLFKDTYRALWEAVAARFPYVFVGPGERSYAALLAALEGGTSVSEYASLPGAISRRDGTVAAHTEDLASFTCPDFSGLPLDAYSTCVSVDDARANDVDFYREPYPLNLLASDRNRRSLPAARRREVAFLPYIFNHHCHYNCAFCEESSATKRTPWSKDAAGVCADLERLVAAYGSEYFHFFNNTFNYTPSFVRELCGMLLERGLGLRWSDCARANGLTRERLELMQRAGCRKLVFGLETASPRLLKYIDKRLDLEHLRRVLSWCQEVGIWADVEVIVGFPYEMEEDFLCTYRFLERNLSLINFFNLNKYFVVPSSLMGTYPERYGIRLVPVRDYDAVLATATAALDRSAGASVVGKPGDTSFHLLSFDELGGRSHEQVMEEAAEKYERMSRLSHQLRVRVEAAAAPAR